MVESTELELVFLARQGDKDAFGWLIERYQGMMNRIALRMLGSSEIAQDMVQEAMLQAYLCLRDLRDERRFRSWLYGIVLNVCKSYIRDQGRGFRFDEALRDEQPEGVWNTGGASQDPQQIILERELHQRVLSAIQELPEAHRQAARMYYYESLTLNEIALITGASQEAIKVRLHRARHSLRQKLQPLYPEYQPAAAQRNGRKAMVKVNVVDIIKKDEKYIIILQDEARGKTLPIWIGPTEGTAIAMGLRAYPTIRPMTYDFMLHLLEALGAKLEEARVEALRETTFYGVASIRIGNDLKEVDARPSDVIALAVRTGSPIYVAEEVMQQASKETAACEDELGPIVPGEGVEAILKEFEEMMKQMQASPQIEEEEQEPPDKG